MPTQIYRLTEAPTNLIGATDINGDLLDLQPGRTYSARYTALGQQLILKLLAVNSGTAVDVDDVALPVRTFEDLILKPKAGEDLVCWGEDGGLLVINPTE
jgi:hypothetical protein